MDIGPTNGSDGLSLGLWLTSTVWITRLWGLALQIEVAAGSHEAGVGARRRRPLTSVFIAWDPDSPSRHPGRGDPVPGRPHTDWRRVALGV